jgi:acyl carrier protein
MNPSDIRAVFQDELSRVAPEVDFEAIDPEADLRAQVDIDSMDFLNLVTALHQRLGVDIPETDYPKLATLQGALSYLEQRTSSS